jgi:hypothetical protein
VGTLTRTVSAKGATRAAAKRAARAKAQKAVARVRKAATTKRGLAAAKRRAIAAAQRVAVTKAHDALYRSTVVYVSTDSAGNFRVTASPTVAGTVRLTRGPGNDIVMTVPAQHDASTVSLPCLLRAPAWPTSYAFDATAVSPQARAMAASHSVGVAAVAVGPVAGATASNPPEVGPEWMAGWEPSSSGPTYWSGYTDDAPRFAGKMVCFGAMLPTDAAGITVTLRGARVGTTISAPDSDGLVDVVGGVPVAIR